MALVLPSPFPDSWEVMKEIMEGSDRVVAIVGGALVEEVLARLLREFLRQDEKVLDQAFGFSKPIGTFSAKVDLGYLLGVYGKEVHQDLHCLRRIRNEFAHKLNTTFKTQKLADLAKNLYLVERYSEDFDHPRKVPPNPRPENLMELPSWIGLRDRDQVLEDPRDRFIGEIQALTWALSAAGQRRVPIGRLG